MASPLGDVPTLKLPASQVCSFYHPTIESNKDTLHTVPYKADIKY